jgi:hypothetical protein
VRIPRILHTGGLKCGDKIFNIAMLSRHYWYLFKEQSNLRLCFLSGCRNDAILLSSASRHCARSRSVIKYIIANGDYENPQKVPEIVFHQ